MAETTKLSEKSPVTSTALDDDDQMVVIKASGDAREIRLLPVVEARKKILQGDGDTPQVAYVPTASTGTAEEINAIRDAMVAAGLMAELSPPTAAGALADQTYTENEAITDLDVSGDFTGDHLTFALAPSSDALVSGLALSAAGVISGTPTASVSGASIVIRATNDAGYADSGFTLDVEAAAVDPLAAYTPSGGSAPDLISDSVNDFYYVKGVGEVTRLQMYPDSDGIIEPTYVPDSTGGLTVVQKGLITYAQDDGSMSAMDTTYGANYFRLGILSQNGTETGRVFGRFGDGVGIGSAYEGAPGTYEPGTDVPYSIGAIMTAADLQIAADGDLVASHTPSAAGFPDTSTIDWETEYSSAYDHDTKILMVWEGSIGNTALQEITAPFL